MPPVSIKFHPSKELFFLLNQLLHVKSRSSLVDVINCAYWTYLYQGRRLNHVIATSVGYIAHRKLGTF